ncbi:sterile alpha motif domain-containing protein 3 [Tachysurus ichikawai]
MAVQQKLTVRVNVAEGHIRIMTMTTKPDRLEDLTEWLKYTLQTNYSFTLQHIDILKFSVTVEYRLFQVQTHPCLEEQGSSSGWDGWKNSVKFRLGQHEVTVNGGKHRRHVKDGNPPNKDIKKPKKGEINFLHENTVNEQNLEGARQALVNGMNKTKPNGSLVKKHMDMTFALRRKEVVNDHDAEGPQLNPLHHLGREFSDETGQPASGLLSFS